jgi:hypothetical protein
MHHLDTSRSTYSFVACHLPLQGLPAAAVFHRPEPDLPALAVRVGAVQGRLDHALVRDEKFYHSELSPDTGRTRRWAPSQGW